MADSDPGQAGGKFGGGGANLRIDIGAEGAVVANAAVVAVRTIANAGLLRGSTGVMTVQETVSSSGGTFELTLIEAPEVARIQIAGTAVLDGTLRLAFDVVTAADSYLVLSADGGITGAFTVLDIPAGGCWSLTRPPCAWCASRSRSVRCWAATSGSPGAEGSHHGWLMVDGSKRGWWHPAPWQVA